MNEKRLLGILIETLREFTTSPHEGITKARLTDNAFSGQAVTYEDWLDRSTARLAWRGARRSDCRSPEISAKSRGAALSAAAKRILRRPFRQTVGAP
jgi:hypothetical protein